MRDARLGGVLVDLVERGTVEDRRCELQAQLAAGPSEHGLVDLPQVHSRRHTQRVQADVDDRTVLEERHVLVAHDTGDDTLVTVAAGHLVTHLQLTLLGDVNLGHLDHAGLRKFVTVGDVVLLALDDGIGLLPLDGIIINGSFDQRIGMGIARPLARAEVQVTHHHARLLVGRLAGDLLEQFLRELRACGIEFHAEVVGDTRRGLALEQRPQLGDQALRQLRNLGCELLVELLELRLLGTLALLALFVRTAVKLRVDDHAVQRWLRLERSVLHVAGLVAEDGAEQLLLRRRIALALGGDLTDQDVARMHVGTDTDDTVRIEVFGGVLAYVRNIRSQLLDTTLGVAHLHDILVDVYRRKDILTLDTLRDHDGILEVVPLPGHERHFQVAAQGQLAVLRRVTLGQDLPLHDLVARQYGGLERDGGILVRTAVTRKFVGRDFRFERGQYLVFRTLVFDLYLGSVGENDLAVALGHNLDAAVGDHILLDTRADDRGFRCHQGHGLAHHVRAHQRTVGVVVLEERDEAGRNRSDLVRSHVHQVHLVRRNHGEIGSLTRLDTLGLQEIALVVDRHVRLRHNLALFLLGRVVVDVRVVQVDPAVLHRAVRRLDESHR